jgi:acetyl-CoA carboxylase biotin carboxyl carrier protein
MADTTIKSEISGIVLSIEKEVGDAVAADETILMLEAMKMEIPVVATVGGSVTKILVSTGEMVTEGQSVCIIAA